MFGADADRTWAEVRLTDFLHNLNYAESVFAEASGESSERQVMPVLKADGYGHGLLTLAKLLDSRGYPFFGVARVTEAEVLQQAGVRTQVMLLGGCYHEERRQVVEQGLVAFISSFAEAQDYSRIAQQLAKPAKLHLGIDTGMGRGGLLPADLLRDVRAILGLPGLEIEGMCSHLSSADEDQSFTWEQIEKFQLLASEVTRRHEMKWLHLANSAGLLGYAAGLCNLARPGIMLYGSSPLPEHQSNLRAAMSLRSRLSLVRELPAGQVISYGGTFVTPRAMRVGTVGVGYGDGYPRALSGRGAEVWIKGQRCRVLGRVTMDQIVVDLEAVDEVREGEVVELFGEHIPIDEIADLANTISYEVLTGITPRVPRRVIQN